MTIPYPPPWMDLTTLAEHICCGERTIETWIRQGTFPQPKRQGGKRLWRWKDVEKHLALSDNLSAQSEADEVLRISNATRQAYASARDH